jgi:hypothetical protein
LRLIPKDSHRYFCYLLFLTFSSYALTGFDPGGYAVIKLFSHLQISKSNNSCVLLLSEPHTRTDSLSAASENFSRNK